MSRGAFGRCFGSVFKSFWDIFLYFFCEETCAEHWFQRCSFHGSLELLENIFSIFSKMGFFFSKLFLAHGLLQSCLEDSRILIALPVPMLRQVF